jgi:predicted RNA binding protein YcfA (HicA-like mRNA interferase family)
MCNKKVRHSWASMRPNGRARYVEGWRRRRAGRGDHVNYNKPGQASVITVDLGMKEIPIGTLRSMYRRAGWQW